MNKRALIALPLLLAGCASYAHREAAAPGAPMQDAAPGFTASAAGRTRQLIRTGSITVEVNEVDAALARLSALAAELGGYVESSHGDESRGSATLRVPSASLETALDRIAEMGEEESRRLDATDVTDQLADLGTQLANFRALRDRLRALLERAADVKDVLAIEEQLTRAQVTVEQLEGQLKRLEEQVALSQIQVHLQRGPILGPFGYIGYGLWWTVKKLFVLRD